MGNYVAQDIWSGYGACGVFRPCIWVRTGFCGQTRRCVYQRNLHSTIPTSGSRGPFVLAAPTWPNGPFSTSQIRHELFIANSRAELKTTTDLKIHKETQPNEDSEPKSFQDEILGVIIKTCEAWLVAKGDETQAY